MAGKEWWYRKQFDAPAAWRAKTVRVCCEGGDYLDDVRLNGHLLGRHEGRAAPFRYGATGTIRYDGPNVQGRKLLDAAAESVGDDRDDAFAQRVRLYRMNFDRLEGFLKMLDVRNRFDFVTAKAAGPFARPDQNDD